VLRIANHFAFAISETLDWIKRTHSVAGFLLPLELLSSFVIWVSDKPDKTIEPQAASHAID